MRKRILTNYIIILILSALIIGALAFYFIKSSYIGNKEEKLLTNITLIEHTLSESYKDVKTVNFYKLAQELSSKTNSRVTFINDKGWPIADSINNSIIFERQTFSQEFRHAIKRELNIVKRYSSEIGDKYFYLALPPIKIGENEVVLRLGDSYDEVDHIIEKFLFYFIIATFVGLCFSMIISYISIGKIIKPIRELTNVSKLIAEGDFDNNIVVDTKDEIEELSLSFNQMAKKLKYTINKIKEKNVEMDAVLSNLQDGILALDINQNIILVNKSVNRILKLDREIKVGEDIKAVLGNLKYIDEIEKSIIDSRVYYDEIKIYDNTKIISLTTYPIEDKNQPQIQTGTLIIIRDITSIRNLERMRKDFVANVSHELRTPLTSISGFVETLKLKELDEKNKAKALDIIEIEVDRLKRLINELLNLSKIESIKEVKQLTEINIEDTIYEVLRLLEPQIKHKNISIEIKIDDNLNDINGEKDLFRQIIINLIENSVRYNNPYGKIDIVTKNYEDGIRLVIEDDGIGIPEEDIPWIFERFYRVDKSRSNNIEGTGLGLSIVNHIVSYFDGTIDVESELEKGSKFTITLPKQLISKQ